MAIPRSDIPIIEQLAATDLFAGLAPEALAEVASRGREQSLKKGSIVFSQGAVADRCYALLDGHVRITQSGTEGGQLVVRFVGPGETFGTVGLFTDRRYPAEAVALMDSVGMSWPEPALLELIDRYPRIALNLVRIVGARLGEVQERLRELATQPVEQRIAHSLLRLADRGVAGKDAVIEFPLTRQDVAAMCGATLYTVSRVLAVWQKAGYITTHRRQVSIRRLDQIRRLAGDAH